MLWRKAVFGLSIFACLFGGAWYIHGELNRYHYIQYPDTIHEEHPPDLDRSHMRSYDVQEQEDTSSPLMEPFAPREYMRIFHYE